MVQLVHVPFSVDPTFLSLELEKCFVCCCHSITTLLICKYLERPGAAYEDMLQFIIRKKGFSLKFKYVVYLKVLFKMKCFCGLLYFSLQ